MKLQLDSRDPLMFSYDELQKHAVVSCTTADAVTLLSSAVVCTALQVWPYIFTTGVLLPQVPQVVNLQTISMEETLALKQAMENVPISKAESTINMKIHTMMKIIHSWTFQQSKSNLPQYGDSQKVGA